MNIRLVTIGLVSALGVAILSIVMGCSLPSLPSGLVRLPPDLVESLRYASIGEAQVHPESRGVWRLQNAYADAGWPVNVRTKKTGILLSLVPPGQLEIRRSCHSGSGWTTNYVVGTSTPIYVGKHEISQGQWQEVMGTNPSYFVQQEGKGVLPVEQVSWLDVQEFLVRLCEMERVPRNTYRVLSDLEWEYACRAGTKHDLYVEFLTGWNHVNRTMDQIAWFWANSDGEENRQRRMAVEWDGKHYDEIRGVNSTTHPIGTLDCNAFSLFDMLGNVEEWVLDSTSNSGVAMGGSFRSGIQEIWLSDHPPPDEGARYRGFRIARSVGDFEINGGGKATTVSGTRQR